MTTTAIFNIFAQGPHVYQDPHTVAFQIEAAETLGTSDFELVADAYEDVLAQEGAVLRVAYQLYLHQVVSGETASVQTLQRSMAARIRTTDRRTWNRVVAQARRRVAEGHWLFRQAYPRFAAEALRGAKIIPLNAVALARGLREGALRSALDIVEIYEREPEVLPVLCSFAQSGNAIALEALDRLIDLEGDEAAWQAGLQINPRRIADSESHEVRLWLFNMIEWGNMAALWAAVRQKERGDLTVTWLLEEADPSFLAKMAEAGDDQARRGVEALAIHDNDQAMGVLEKWVRAGQGKYARFLYRIALKNRDTTKKALDHLVRLAATHDFNLLFWLFELLEAFNTGETGYRYEQLLSDLRSFDLGGLAAAARQNLLAFYWLIQLGLIGHPAAFREAYVAMEPLAPRLNPDNAACQWLLKKITPQILVRMEATRDPHAQLIVWEIRGLQEEAAAHSSG